MASCWAAVQQTDAPNNACGPLAGLCRKTAANTEQG
jgi:hypothetical protein